MLPTPCPVPQVTFQQICKDVHLVKHQGQQLFIESRARPLPRPRVPCELARVWVGSEAWGVPQTFSPTQEFLSPWTSYWHIQGQDPSLPIPRPGGGPSSNPGPIGLGR